MKIITFFFSFFVFTTNAQSDSSLVLNHLNEITRSSANPRTHLNVDVLDKVAEYIFREFEKYCDTFYYQTYQANGYTYRNVIGVFGDTLAETIVVGAHYDVCGQQEGADDNASGVVGLLEIARMLSGKVLKSRIELVAYTLEEPPYFRSEYMGSNIHAQSVIDRVLQIKGMVCLEMIGYFKDEKKTQSYPLGILKLFYGSRGDYITLVNKFGKGKFARRFSKKFKKQKTIKTKKFSGPKSLQGIDFSDHLNYWSRGISALMITDTSFYRNANYHHATDTIETLDIGRMVSVIDATLQTILIL